MKFICAVGLFALGLQPTAALPQPSSPDVKSAPAAPTPQAELPWWVPAGAVAGFGSLALNAAQFINKHRPRRTPVAPANTPPRRSRQRISIVLARRPRADPAATTTVQQLNQLDERMGSVETPLSGLSRQLRSTDRNIDQHYKWQRETADHAQELERASGRKRTLALVDRQGRQYNLQADAQLDECLQAFLTELLFTPEFGLKKVEAGWEEAVDHCANRLNRPSEDVAALRQADLVHWMLKDPGVEQNPNPKYPATPAQSSPGSDASPGITPQNLAISTAPLAGSSAHGSRRIFTVPRLNVWRDAAMRQFSAAAFPMAGPATPKNRGGLKLPGKVGK